MFRDHLEIEDHGSIVRMLPISELAKNWWEENVDPECPMMGKYYCVEHGFAYDIINGLECYLSDADIS